MGHRKLKGVVLLAEDDADLRFIYGSCIRHLGYEVREASDGLQALAALDLEIPDLLVLDLKLPFVSGTDILEELEAHDHTRAIPVLVVTGTLARPSNRNVFARLGKPVTCEQLMTMVSRCLPQD